MELNKCKRCGAFFASNNNICPNCEPKDIRDLSKLKCFLEENTCPNSIESLSYDTDISAKNIARFIEGNNLPNISIKL